MTSYLLAQAGSIVGWITAGLSACLILWIMAKRDTRLRSRLDDAEAKLNISKKAEEIENEVESLSADDLHRRSTRWVRDNH